MKLASKIQPGGIAILELTGRVHMGKDCAEIDREINHQLQQQIARIVIDLAGVDHIDSAFIGEIVKAHANLKRAGGALRLSGATGMVASSLKLTQVHNVVGLYATAHEAVASFA
jgi:anti-sigma B factor antagonist